MHRFLLQASVFLLLLVETAAAQVHYHEDGRPWNRKARRGPDAVVEGWYYNLGITGMRAQLVAERPNFLLVRHVLEDSPAAAKVRVGDWIVGAAGKPFATPHQNGYGMEVFGAAGPISDFAHALEQSQDNQHKGRLTVQLERAGQRLNVDLEVGRQYGLYGPAFPSECPKSDRLLAGLYKFLEDAQREDGSWGSPPHDTFAPLALLASGDSRHLPLVKKNVQFHARTTKSKDKSWLINWRYMSAAIVMSEYYLATGEAWVLDELQEVYDFLVSSQYVDMSQISEKTRRDRPRDVPKDKMSAHGGWGHNPGFEGYGPISMLTGQGALAFALMKHCGVEVDRERHQYAYDFLVRSSGRNGYVWYADKAASQENWADMGRTGAAGIANAMCPYPDPVYRQRALSHARVIGAHPESFPDTHGSPIMGMGYAALAARIDPPSFRKLMDSNKWWFVLAQCPDGSFYYQPNRDNAGYGADSRLSASAVTAFIFSLDKKSLFMTGRKPTTGR